MTRIPRQNGEGGDALLLARIDEGVRRLAHAMVILSGWGVLAMGLLVAADVLWRAVSGRNFGGVDEIASYLFAIGVAWSLASAFHARAHIRVDIFYRRLPLVPRVVIDLLAMLSLLLVAVFLIYSSWTVLETSWARSARSASTMQIPLIVPQALWCFGICVFCLSILSALLRAAAELPRGRLMGIAGRHGVIRADEEAQEAVIQSRGER